MTTNEMKAWLEARLGRPIEVASVNYLNSRMFMVEYINLSAPATKLVSDTEDGAIKALYDYLSPLSETSD